MIQFDRANFFGEEAPGKSFEVRTHLLFVYPYALPEWCSSSTCDDSELSSNHSHDEHSASEAMFVPKLVKVGSRKRKMATQETIVAYPAVSHGKCGYTKSGRVSMPRIPKSDVRRRYGLMFSNVCNSLDLALLRQFTQTMMSRDFRFVLVNGADTEDRCDCDMELSQAEVFWNRRMLFSPDLVLYHDAQRIKVRSDGTAWLTGPFRMQGTKVVSTRQVYQLLRQNSIPVSKQRFYEDYWARSTQIVNEDELIDPSRPSFSLPADSLHVIKMCPGAIGYSESLFPQPAMMEDMLLEPILFPFVMHGQISFDIDAQYRISNIKMVVDTHNE